MKRMESCMNEPDKVIIEPDRFRLLLPISKVLAIITFTVTFTVGTIVFINSVRDAIKANMIALNLIACQGRWQLYNMRNASAHYAGECERNVVD